jgi:hypothetical protein
MIADYSSQPTGPQPTGPQPTGRFISRWAYVSLGLVGLMSLALLSVPFWQRLLLTESLSVSEGDSVELPTIALPLTRWGALRVEAMASLPWGQSATYEIQIRDRTGQVIGSAVKDAWAETGQWAEEGESGTWDETDVAAGLDLRSKQAETLTLAIAVLDHTNTAGLDLNKPIRFTVQVYSGAIDDRYLWAGLLGTLCTTLLAFGAVPTSGRRAIAKTMRRAHEVTERGDLKGGDRLLRLTVQVKAPPHAPSVFTLSLTIHNADGESIFSDRVSLATKYSKHEGKTTGAGVRYTGFFMLASPGSYGFSAAISPEDPILKTTLTVYEDAHTLIPVPVRSLS